MKTKHLLAIILLLLTGRMVFAQAPVINSFSPSTGPVGTVVAVRGSGFGSPFSFNIGGKPALIITNNGTKIVAMVMPGAVTGSINITTADGTANAAVPFNITEAGSPITPQGGRLSATDLAGNSQQGSSVAVSADGTTAIIGGFADDGNKGAAWIYKLRGSSWISQTHKLIGSNTIGAAQQGITVAINADGNTAIVGGNLDNNGTGAVWIYIRRPDSTWVQQGVKLTPGALTSATLNFGSSAAISADGNTAVIGAPGDTTTGSVWVFKRNGTTWTQQARLFGTGSTGTSVKQASSVAISANGNSILIGAPGDNAGAGAAWVFNRTGNTWVQRGNKLLCNDAIGAPLFGTSVALNADGSLALIGGTADNNLKGAAWVFALAGGAWSQYGGKLTANDGVGNSAFGGSVAINADGKTLVIGGRGDNAQRGGTWIFKLYGDYSQQGGKILSTDAIGVSEQGASVSISASGLTMLMGGPKHKTGKGAAWAYTTTGPMISSVSPATGPVGTLVTIKGTGLSNISSITIAGKPAVLLSSTGTSATAMVMPGATSGAAIVTAGGNSNTSAASFNVTPVSAPNMQQGARLSANDLTGNSAQGLSVAVSADGKTAIVGGYADNSYLGAAWIYKLAGNNWILQSNKLVGTGAVGATVYQGKTVAISADGNTAIVGGYSDNNGIGTAWVYIRRSDSTWAQQGDKITGTGVTGAAGFGYSVALSADGNTAIIGAYHDDGIKGAAWIFNRNGGAWLQQGSKLVGTGNAGNGSQGSAVAMSADGTTAMVSGFNDNGGIGASWIYIKSGTTWAQQGSKLVGTGNTGASHQGFSIALSADGNTAVTGGSADNTNNGAVWVFTRKGTSWTQYGTKIANPTGAVGAPGFGKSVSLTADGLTAAIGGYQDNTSVGAAWVYQQVNGGWAQQGSKLTGNDAIGAASQGISVAISANGLVMLSGGSAHKSGKGAVWAYNSALPTISSFYPSSGPVGTLVALAGTNLAGQSIVTIGGKPAVVVSKADTKLVAMVMPGAVNGSVAVLNGSSAVSASATYTVTEPLAPNTQRGDKVTTGNTNSNALFGCASAMSADGQTAVIGAYNDNAGAGAVFVFQLGSDGWAQTEKLIATGGNGNSNLGKQLALSADGSTIIAGGITGAAWIFTKQANGTWAQQGPILPGTGFVASGTDEGVGISADGNTAVFSCFGISTNTSIPYNCAWVLVKNKGIWVTQSILIPNDSTPSSYNSGYLYATVSADGNTVALASPTDNINSGAVWLFNRVGINWSQQGPKLSNYPEGFGAGIALNADATTLAVGTSDGSIRIFNRNGNVWLRYGDKISVADYLGGAIRLNADGKILVAGSPSSVYSLPTAPYYNIEGKGAVYVFKLVNGLWIQNETKLVGTESAVDDARISYQGHSVAISATGTEMISGAYKHEKNRGAFWGFYGGPPLLTPKAKPVINFINPTSGPVGTPVTITGTNLDGATVITIAGKAVIPISNTGTKMVAMVMPGAATGPVTATVGTVSVTSEDNFTVTAPNPPIVQRGNKLTANDAVGQANQGFALALSADANTAVIGGYYDNNGKGAAWIYKKSGGSWTKITKLVGADSASITGIRQGSAVAISADGNTVMIAGNYQKTAGILWVFARQADSTWAQQGQMIYSPGGARMHFYDRSLALSADGNTAIVGGMSDAYPNGTAWILVRSGDSWIRQKNLLGTGGIGNSNQGQSVSISADGKTAIIGGPDDNAGIGAAWIFTRDSAAWAQQGAKMLGTGYVGKPKFGSSVALNADGNTAIIGGSLDNSNVGALWAFTRSGTTWAQFGNKITGAAGTSHVLGTNVALSADGKTIVGGQPGDSSDAGMFVFKLVNNNWTQQGNKITGTGGATDGNQGYTVAVSADGTEAMLGSPSDNSSTGAVWAFTVTPPPPPVITSFSPASGPVGTLVTVNITNYAAGSTLLIGGKPALVTSNDGTSLIAMVMPEAITGAVTITSNNGNAPVNAAGVFTVTTQAPPITQQGGKLVVTSSKSAAQSSVLSISADGTMAIMGAPYDGGSYSGSAHFFSIEPGGGITDGDLPLPSISTKYFGSSVAISANGNAAVASGYSLTNSNYFIQFYIYQSSQWNVDGMPILGLTTGNATLSADGKTAVVYGSYGNPAKGTVYVYTRNHGIWQQKTDLLSGFITAIALQYYTISADGKTIMVAATDSNGLGIWVFTLVNNVWLQQGAKLVAPEQIGYSIVLSADGNSAIIGANYGYYNFVRTGNSWAQYGNKITNSDFATKPIPGNLVSSTADGKMFVAGYPGDSGGYGATCIFQLINNVWTQRAKVTGTGGVYGGEDGNVSSQGQAVAISATGNEMLTGAHNDGGGKGATWAFYAAPVQQTQSISFKQLVALTTNSQAEDVFASASSGLPVEYTTSNPNVAKVENGQLKIIGRGPVTITALQKGNKEFKPATPVSHTLTVSRSLIPNSLQEITGPTVDPALSPNGDGKNDVLTITNIEMYPDNKLSIINTNGDGVYQATGYNNQSKAFDGTSTIDGKKQKPGTYYYRLEYKDNGVLKTKTGYIVIKY